jgi:hypothetical protein
LSISSSRLSVVSAFISTKEVRSRGRQRGDEVSEEPVHLRGVVPEVGLDLSLDNRRHLLRRIVCRRRYPEVDASQIVDDILLDP